MGIGIAVVLALAAVLVTWVLVQRGARDDPRPASPAAAADGPRVATAEGLSTLAALRRAPVYWAGQRAGVVFEVTENAAGHVYVRYLPSGTAVGDPRPDFLTVATYTRPNAFADVEAAAARPGAVTIDLPGGLAVYDRSTPTSVYLAYRGTTGQIEVYAPEPGEARRLVESGRISPVP